MKNENKGTPKNETTDVEDSVLKLNDQISALEKNVSKLSQRNQHQFLQQNKDQHNQFKMLENLNATILSFAKKLSYLDHGSNLHGKNISTLFNKMLFLEKMSPFS